MKSKLMLPILLLILLAACSPGAAELEPDIESRSTIVPTILAQATETAMATVTAPTTAVPPTLLPSPFPQATPTPALPTPSPETAVYTPRFDRFLPFFSGNDLSGLVWQDEQWQLQSIPLLLGTHPIDSDYAVATHRLLSWQFRGGAGPGQLAVGELSLTNVETLASDVYLPNNVVSAGWAPNGRDFAYIFATDTTYELRWQTAVGENKLLAIDVPHSLRVSPDGRYVAFTRESHYSVDGTPPGLYVVEIETGIETQVSPLDRAGYGGSGPYWKPHWSPDSSQLFLFATADNDRAATPHEEGYVWAAADGSFNHFLPISSFKSFFSEEPLANSDLVRCIGSPALFATNKIILPIGECPAFGVANPETARNAVFALDGQTGGVELLNVLSTQSSAALLTWDIPGNSVLLLEEGVVRSVSVLAE